MKEITKATIASVVATLLIGCGGGDTSNNSTSDSGDGQIATSTAQFVDNYVEGLIYINGSTTGYTDSNGEFSYRDGEISFYLGNMLLGTIDSANIPSDSKLFVQDLVGVDRNETSNAAVLKMATLLQTLDADPSTETIEINATVRDGFDANTTLANFPDANITNAYRGLGITRVAKSVEVQAHLEDMRRFHGEVSDTTTPTVVSNTSYTNVELDDELCIDFSERIPKNLITATNFTVNPATTGTLYRDDTEVCFTPDANLTAGQTYTFTVDGGITDYGGNALGADVSVSYEVPAAVIQNQAAVWNLANGTTQTAIEGSGAYIIDLTGSTDADSDTLSYEWFIVPDSAATPTYNQSSGNIAVGTATTINFATADARTNTPVALPAGDYRLLINQYEDRGSSNPVVTQQVVAITITAAAVQNRPFIIEIDTTATPRYSGSSDTNQSRFIVKNYNIGSTLAIDCNNDGTFEKNDLGYYKRYDCSYDSSGVYEVAIKEMNRNASSYTGSYLHFNESSANLSNTFKITKIISWGDIEWESTGALFDYANNLTGISENAGTPNFTRLYSTSNMFRGATQFDANLSRWDVSSASIMLSMFEGASSFSSDISDWNTSNVTTMTKMFKAANAFNHDISMWDTSNLGRVDFMFQENTLYNQDLSDWSVSEVSVCTSFADGATAFQAQNQPNFTKCTP